MARKLESLVKVLKVERVYLDKARFGNIIVLNAPKGPEFVVSYAKGLLVTIRREEGVFRVVERTQKDIRKGSEISVGCYEGDQGYYHLDNFLRSYGL